MRRSKNLNAQDTGIDSNGSDNAAVDNAVQQKSLEQRIDEILIIKKEQLKTKRDEGKNLEDI